MKSGYCGKGSRNAISQPNPTRQYGTIVIQSYRNFKVEANFATEWRRSSSPWREPWVVQNSSIVSPDRGDTIFGVCATSDAVRFVCFAPPGRASWKGLSFQWVRAPPGNWSFQPEAARVVVEVTKP